MKFIDKGKLSATVSIESHGICNTNLFSCLLFSFLTLASMVTSSARLWVRSWYLHWRPW